MTTDNAKQPGRGGPLAGIRILEFEGIGPAPFAAMLLSDLGADVCTIARPGKTRRTPAHFIWRGREFVELDLKSEADAGKALELTAESHVLLEGFRPGVMERLGLGPEVALGRNPALIYGRMTGWGQHGPLARRAGHDITYIAITGALDAFRARDGMPVAPLNLVGDYAGGAMYLVAGVLAGLIHARATGQGQVIDAAMCDGVSHLLMMFQSLRAQGLWQDAPRANRLDGGAHFYNVYACKDGGHVAVGPIEPQFYAELSRLSGLDPEPAPEEQKPSEWARNTARLEAIFATKTRDEWNAIFSDTDACVAPVLSMKEAPDHPHIAARQIYVEANGQRQPAPAPRFSATPASIGNAPQDAVISAQSVLDRWRSTAR